MSSNKEKIFKVLKKILNAPPRPPQPAPEPVKPYYHLVDVTCCECGDTIHVYHGPADSIICYDCGNTRLDARSCGKVRGASRPEDGSKHDFGTNHSWIVYGYDLKWQHRLNINMNPKLENKK